MVDSSSVPVSPRALPDVTLVAVTGVALPQTVRAMALSLEQVDFGAALLLCDRPPAPGGPPSLEWRQIEQLGSRAAYSRFMLRDLHRHIATRHVLCVQWDGYVLDAGGWRPEFLDYDYIGAPWPQFDDDHRVGNGGFSLRSHRLLEACVSLDIGDIAEDVAICRVHRALLEKRFGIRFAPIDVARRFAYERYPRQGGEFGFHGALNLARLTDDATFVSLLTGLEANIMTAREQRELLWFAMRRGRFDLAKTIARRIRERRISLA